jgi:phosphoglycerol geranylgeranyltransferase
MNHLYLDIVQAKKEGKKLLAILLDPDKIDYTKITELSKKINQSPATHVFVGGSMVKEGITEKLIVKLKEKIKIPILIFPGHPSQISHKADGLLFLSLLSGRNTDFLIEHHINAIEILKDSTLEIIPTGYLLIDGGIETAVQKVSQTQPIDRSNIDLAFKTAKAGEYLGKKLIYLEAGSGATHCVPLKMIHEVAITISVPLIVGGGIKNKKQIEEVYQAGADIVVIGTAFENDLTFFD